MLARPAPAPGVRARARSRCSTPRTRRCWPTCAASTPATTAPRTSCCASTTSSRFAQPVELHLAAPRRQGADRAPRPRAVPARSASCPTSSRCRGYGFYWFTLHRPGGGLEQHGRADRPGRPRSPAARLPAPAALVRRRRPPPRRGVDVTDFDVLRDGSPWLVWALADARFADGEHGPVPGARRRAPARRHRAVPRGQGPRVARRPRHARRPRARLRRARRSRAGAGPPAPHRPRRDGRPRAAAERRAVEHVGRLRRAADPQAVPPGGRRAEPRRRGDRGARRARASPTSARRSPRGGATVATSPSSASSSTAAPTGWHLALTSLRDLYDSRLDPAESGGDFAPEAEPARARSPREMHVALADAFGVEPGERGGVGRPPWRRISNACRPTGSTSPPVRGRVRRAARRSTTPAPPSASTATTTSGRRCAPTRAGTSSTSRASPRCRSSERRSARRRCATSPACCARSTTRRSPVCSSAASSSTTSCASSAAVGAARGEAFLERLPRDAEGMEPLPADDGDRDARARRVHAGEGGVRGRLRGGPPSRLGVDPAGGRRRDSSEATRVTRAAGRRARGAVDRRRHPQRAPPLPRRPPDARAAAVVRAWRPGAAAVTVVVGDQRVPAERVRRRACSTPARPRARALPARGRVRRRHGRHGRRPVPVLAHARRRRPPPHRRGAPRAPVGRARRPPPRPPGQPPAPRSRCGRRRPRAVRVVGDFNFWDGRVHPMRSLGSSGVWELFVPGVAAGRPLQVRDPRRRRRSCGSRPTRWRAPAEIAAGHGVDRRRVARTSGATATGWTQRAASDADQPAHCRSTRCTSGRGGACRRRATAAHVPRARRRAGRLRRRPRLHPRRADAGRRAPVRRLVGLPGVGRTTRRRRGTGRPTTSRVSSTACTSAASA